MSKKHQETLISNAENTSTQVENSGIQDEQTKNKAEILATLNTRPRCKKLPMDQLFKSGDNFELAYVDYGSEQVTKNIEEIKKRCAKIQADAENRNFEKRNNLPRVKPM